jgi:malate dehydrogenase (oxaloacetate-decarboxylating)
VWEQHRGGKISIQTNAVVRTLQDIREVYTPGVARVVLAIAEDESIADEFTWRGRTLAIVTNGTRVLGLGDVGPAAALPVMEGKALFYADLVGLNAVPIVLDTKDPQEVIETVVRLAPGFGGIHLEDIATPEVYEIERELEKRLHIPEDIATPEVYEIERELEKRLHIPVFHDDQHGTAVVVIAAVISAARRIGKPLSEMTFAQVGLGAAGSAIAGLASGFGFRSLSAFDPNPLGIDRLMEVAEPGIEIDAGTTTEHFDGMVAEADILVLTTGQPGLLKPEQVKKGQIIMALTNPVPEISYRTARDAGAAVAADGSIVNNVLSYPGLLAGALDAKSPSVTAAMKRAAAYAIADAAAEGQLLPDPLDQDLHNAVRTAVRTAAV